MSKKGEAKPKIYTHRLDGKIIGFTREHRANSAQARFLENRLTTTLASDEELMEIGRQGAAIGGLDPTEGIDPAQLDWVDEAKATTTQVGAPEGE